MMLSELGGIIWDTLVADANNDGGKAWGISNPFNFIVIILHAIENSLMSICPSPFMSDRPLKKSLSLVVRKIYYALFRCYHIWARTIGCSPDWRKKFRAWFPVTIPIGLGFTDLSGKEFAKVIRDFLNETQRQFFLYLNCSSCRSLSWGVIDHWSMIKSFP